MNPKLLGSCTKCDAEVFDIVERDIDRLPKRVGAAHDDAIRVNFLMLDGSRMDLTFCQPCADGLIADDLQWIWRRVMKSWPADHPWTKTQTENGLLAILNKKPWKEVL